MNKPLDRIKHSNKIVEVMPEEELFFVDDIKRATGLDDKTLKIVLQSMLKNGYLFKNERGLWYRLPEAA